jgi:hypothetical protein
MDEKECFYLLSRRYVQRADDRQAEMGLQYMTAETHELARFLAAEIACAVGKERLRGEPIKEEKSDG